MSKCFRCEELRIEIERLREDLRIQTVNATAVLQAQHERDEWSGVAAQRNRERLEAQLERDAAVEKLAQIRAEYAACIKTVDRLENGALDASVPISTTKE